MSVSEPGKIITPWAESGLKNPIPPAANPATGRAGFDQGFSAINMTAKEAGGIPPFGQDFNGIFYEVTNILRYMQAGGQPTFSSALATAIGGYPKGAMVLGSDGVTLWQSKVDSNSTNPNIAPSSWGKVDVGLRADLGSDIGSGIVGYTQGQVGAIPFNLLDKFRESSPTVSDFCTPILRNKILNNSATSADAPAISNALNNAIQAALNHPTKILNLGSGTILVNGRVTLPDGIRGVVGDGKHSCTIKMSGGVNDYVIFSENTTKCDFYGFSVDGNFSENPTGLSGFYSLKSKELDFFYVKVMNCGGSGFFSSAGGEFNPSSTSKFRYYGCEAYNNGGNYTAPATTGFNLNADEVVLVSCRSSFNGGGGFKTSGRMIRHYGSHSHDNDGNGFSNDFATGGQGDIFHYGSIAEDNEFNALYLSSTTRNVELHGFVGRRNGQCGLYILNNVQRVKVFGGDLRNNGKDPTSQFRHGVLVRNTGPAPSDIILNGVTITDDQDVKTQQYAVSIEGDGGATSTANKISILGRSDISGNAIGAIMNNSSGFNIVASPDTIGLAQAHSPSTSSTTGGVTTPVVLETITIPAYELGRRGGFKITSVCGVTGVAGNKQVTLKIGGASIPTLSTTTSDGGYVLNAELYVASTTSLRGWYASSISGGVGGRADRLIFGTDINSSITIELIATTSSAADTIVSSLWRVERLNGLS